MSGQKKLLKGLMGTAGALALMVSVAGEAKAGSVSYSFLSISDFIISDDATGTQLDASDFDLLVALNAASTSATLNGVTQNDVVIPTLASVDPDNVCVGASCPVVGDNTFTFIQPDGASGSFAQADGDQGGSIVTGLAIGSPANATTEGQVQLLGNSSGSTQTTITAGSTFDFVLGQDTEVLIEFDADGDLVARLNEDAKIGSLAFASYSFEITIRNAATNVIVFQWSPDGTVNGDIVGGTENTDDFALVDSATALLALDDIVVDEAGFFSATTDELSADVRYLLSISHTSITNGVKVVPEPATLALMAGGLVILGFFGLRGRRPEDRLGAS